MEIRTFDCLESTNLTAKQLALEGAAHGTVIAADTQTGGKGRMGKSFFSPSGGIYMSIILRPNIAVNENNMITVWGVRAVVRSIEKLYGITPDVRGINDILINGRKVCGILTEAMIDTVSGNAEFIVLGIGINFQPVTFPEDIKDIAGALPVREDITREQLITEISNNILSDIES